MLVLTGATGGVGVHAARLIAAQGQPLRLLARDRMRLEELPNAEVVQTDYVDPAGLAQGLQEGDVDFMVSINAAHDERMRLHSAFIAAAAKAEVAHIVYWSFLCAGPEAEFLHVRAHWKTEKLIRAAGLPFTFLRTSFYDTVTTMFYLDDLALGPAGAGAVTWVSRPDCGAAVAAVMLDSQARDDLPRLIGRRGTTLREFIEANRGAYQLRGDGGA